MRTITKKYNVMKIYLYHFNNWAGLKDMLCSTYCWSSIFGGLGFLITALILSYFIFSPIRRDIRLTRKNYWVWVGLFMLATAATLQFWGVIYSYVASTKETASIPWQMLLFFFGSSIDPEPLAQSPTGISYLLMILIKVFVINGILVATIVGLFNRRINHFNAGEIRYRRLVFWCLRNKYAVVIGFNEVTASIIKNLLHSCQHKQEVHKLDCYCDRKLNYILLQTNRKASEVRTQLESQLSEEELNRVIIYTAYRDSEKELKKLYLQYAYNIYILGEQTACGEPETFHDTMNMKCLNMIAKYLQRYKQKGDSKLKECRVMFEYQTTHSVFQFSDVSKEVKETLKFIPFNQYESWARKILVDNNEYQPLDGREGIKYEDDEHVHLVIVGMSNMGIALGIQALYQAHYPNYVRNSLLKTRVAFIDRNADKEMAFFQGRYATLFELVRHRYIDANKCNAELLNSEEDCGVDSDSMGYKWIDPMQNINCQWKHLSNEGKNFLDVEIEFVKGELESKGVRHYLTAISKDQTSKLTIAICLTNAHQAIAASLYMPTEVYANKNMKQILVYQRHADDIICNIKNETNSSKRYNNLYPFGMIYANYVDDNARYWKAVLVNAVYDASKSNKPLPNIHNRKNQDVIAAIDSWERLKECKKISNKLFADSIEQKLRCICSDQEVMAKCEHNRWNIEQLLMGFAPISEEDDKTLRELVAAGEPTDNKKRELKESSDNVHPNICDFAHLSAIDPGAKDYDINLNRAIPEIRSLVHQSL